MIGRGAAIESDKQYNSTSRKHIQPENYVESRRRHRYLLQVLHVITSFVLVIASSVTPP